MPDNVFNQRWIIQGTLQADIISTSLKAFKAARLFDSHYLNKVKPQNAALNSLSVLPFVTEPTMAQLKEEYPQYTAAAEDLSPDCEIGICLPTTFLYGRRMLLLQPSSAAAERVFSILKNSFGDQQLSAFEDYLEASLIIQYNK